MPPGLSVLETVTNHVAPVPDPSGGVTYEPLGSSGITQFTLEVPNSLIAEGVNVNGMNAVIWTIWNEIYTASTSSTITNTVTNTILTSTMPTITTSETWGAWNAKMQAALNSMAITTSATTNSITTSTVTTSNLAAWTAWNAKLHNATQAEVAEAQRQANEARAREQQRQAQVQVDRSAAEKRAEKLLQDHLTPKQREELAARGFFTVSSISQDGQRRHYQIRRGRSRNVQQVDESGRVLKTLCAHPVPLLPDADTMLAQKLMLETREEDFLRIANHS